MIGLEYIFEGLFKAWEVMWASDGSGLFFAGAFFAAIVLFILGMIQNRVVRYPVYSGTPTSDQYALPEPEEEHTPLLTAGEEVEVTGSLGHRELVVTDDDELAVAPNPPPIPAPVLAPNSASIVAPNEEPLPPKIPERTPPIGEPVLAPNIEPNQASTVAPNEEPTQEPKESGLLNELKRDLKGVVNKLVPPPPGLKEKTPDGMVPVAPGKGELAEEPESEKKDDEPVFEFASEY